MSDKKLIMLGLIAVIAVAAAIGVNQMSKPHQSSTLVTGPLVGGLDVDQIAKITISGEKGSQKMTLSRSGGKFVIVEKDNYPASVKKVNELVGHCLDIRTTELKSEDAAFHKDLGVTDDTAKSVVTFWNSEDKSIVGLYVSENVEDGNGAYVRLANENKVYLTLTVPWISAAAMDYVDKELLKVDTGKVVEVSVADPNQNVYTLQSKDSGKTITSPKELPVGKRLKESEVKRVFIAAGGIQIEDVVAADKVGDIKLDRLYVCKLDDSTLYTFQMGEKDKKIYLVTTAEFTDTTPVTKEKGVESEEQLKAKETKLVARDAADRFAKKTNGWFYVISDYSASMLKKKLSEIIEDIPAEPTTPAADAASQSAPQTK